MKNLGKIVLIGMLALSSLSAKELLFDLRSQDFANTLDDKQIDTKYKVSDKIMVETNMLKSTKNGSYYGKDALFSIKVANGLKNWKTNIDITYKFCCATNIKRYIKFIDKFGKTIVLEFIEGSFTLNGKKYKAKFDEELLSLEIIKRNENIIILMNNQKLYDSKVDFDNLKYININNFPSTVGMGYDNISQILVVSYDD